MKKNKAFTLIELLVAISIIAFISSIISAALAKSRIKARDSQRIQNARQLAIALEQYEATYNTYKVSNAGKNNEGYGYVAKETGTPGYTTSILSALKSAGLYNSTKLVDPVYGTDNYYLGLCTSTNAYNIFVKLEQSQYNNSTTSISNTCGGAEAASLGFNFIASTVGGTSGGGGDTTGLGGSYDYQLVYGVDGLAYRPIVAENGSVWLDRNLGATRVATSYNDTQAYGYYFQWGRGNDNHQISTSNSTTTLSSIIIPTHGLFITNSSTSSVDWLITSDNTLWQSGSDINNPCPSGFRVPTNTEWVSVVSSIPNFSSASCGISNTCRDVAFNSSLKLTAAGYRDRSVGVFSGGSTVGHYWTSDVSTNAREQYFNQSSVSTTSSNYRAYGFSVRCIKK